MSPLRHRTDGDGWIECSCGHRHWGLFGSAGLLLVDPARGVLLQHRAEWSHHGGTWGVPGGARASGEAALDAAVREAHEEAAVPPELVRPSHAWIEDHGTWSYTTVVAAASTPFDAYASDPESLAITWIPVDQVDALPLHPSFGALWPSIRDQLPRRLVLVVDGANVVGSRPDGWWRDRAGAAARLRDQLALSPPLPASDLGLPATLWWPDVHLVVEGAARGLDAPDGGADSDGDRGVPVSVSVKRAPGHGDDTVVEVAAAAVTARPQDHVVVVTADRELRSRAERAGAATIGPGTLTRLFP
ncbi:NUDIX hydrolase [Phytoactinopolyspora alkaliphila]|uniref:NUDIX hydrolase n=1 Tax=Phytoactinopolyspora alkaliphila TaxID=1783498 RepID=A0A6N9YG13_9ACTN|nr:NUDIX hydrolase [Phytoactinopolyspora alkaliphila]NED94001.1 NUDIX hydrolase [Phytoactinopolyspora alkaliphila]